jgi:hypothetical protein
VRGMCWGRFGMNELERARRHLGDVQCNLSFIRQQGGTKWGLALSEREVLAALSWVYDAQERAKPQPVVQEVVFG